MQMSSSPADSPLQFRIRLKGRVSLIDKHGDGFESSPANDRTSLSLHTISTCGIFSPETAFDDYMDRAARRFPLFRCHRGGALIQEGSFVPQSAQGLSYIDVGPDSTRQGHNGGSRMLFGNNLCLRSTKGFRKSHRAGLYNSYQTPRSESDTDVSPQNAALGQGVRGQSLLQSKSKCIPHPSPYSEAASMSPQSKRGFIKRINLLRLEDLLRKSIESQGRKDLPLPRTRRPLLYRHPKPRPPPRQPRSVEYLQPPVQQREVSFKFNSALIQRLRRKCIPGAPERLTKVAIRLPRIPALAQ